MNFLENKENRIGFIIWAVLGIFFSALGFSAGPAIGFLVSVVVLSYGALFYKLTKNRTIKVMKMVDDVEAILYNDDFYILDSIEEGELALLKNTVKKMTLRIREYDSLISKEKIYLSDSLSDISHQLRTPLTTIGMLVSFLQKPDIDELKKRKYLRDINRQLQKLDWLISSLLKISKMDAGTIIFKREDKYMSDIVGEALKALMVPLELKEQRFEFSSLGKEKVFADIDWTSEALLNIFKNCMEHTQVGGIITVVARDNPIFTEVVIKDNGPGIDKDDIGNIFKRFYKGKNSSNSSVGIGLALSRMIIESQNGTIKVQNNIDKGACFTIRFYKGVVNGSS